MVIKSSIEVNAMLSYEKNFSPRADGRYVCTFAAEMARVRDMYPSLQVPKVLDKKSFYAWQKKIKERLLYFLQLPMPTEQPAPVMLSCVQREGYRVEKWEFYPDDYMAVPFLALIPDTASAESPVPAVMCFPGSNHSKEFMAGEPLGEHPNMAVNRYPDRNQMAKYYAQNGFAAFAFDHPGIGETSVLGDPAYGENQFYTRSQMCAGMLRFGRNYLTLSVAQKLAFMEQFLDVQSYIDHKRVAISGHSLGTEVGAMLAVLREDISAMVFNECIKDEYYRFAGVTEMEEDAMVQDIGNWHTVPYMLTEFDMKDLCAAFAPRPLALTEGAGDGPLEAIKRAYEATDALDDLTVVYYPAFQPPEEHRNDAPMPNYGMTADFFHKHNHIEIPDHSFRAAPAVKMLKKCFGMD